MALEMRVLALGLETMDSRHSCDNSDTRHSLEVLGGRHNSDSRHGLEVLDSRHSSVGDSSSMVTDQV